MRNTSLRDKITRLEEVLLPRRVDPGGRAAVESVNAERIESVLRPGYEKQLEAERARMAGNPFLRARRLRELARHEAWARRLASAGPETLSGRIGRRLLDRIAAEQKILLGEESDACRD